MRSTILYGAADSIAEQLDALLESDLRSMRARHLDEARAVLNERRFDESYEAGRRLSLSDAVGLVEGIGSGDRL